MIRTDHDEAAKIALLVLAVIVGAILGGAGVLIEKPFDRAKMAPETVVVTPTPTPTETPQDAYWEPVTRDLGDALAEGDSEPPANADTRRWEDCLVSVGFKITEVVCPDGYSTTF